MKYLFVILSVFFVLSLCAQTGIKTWKEQLEYVKRRDSTRTSGVLCVDYRYKTKIENEDQKNEWIDRLFADSAMTVHYYDGFLYEIVPFGELKRGPQGREIEKWISELKAELKNTITLDIVVVEIEWKFKGKTYYSDAIAWPKGGIIYDNICSFILDRVEKVEMKTQGTI